MTPIRRIAMLTGTLLLLALPGTAVAGGTWTSSDFTQLTIDWKTDGGQSTLAIDITLTQPATDAFLPDSGGKCDVSMQDPKQIHCPVRNLSSGRVIANVSTAVGCADSFGLSVQAGQASAAQQPITSANSCEPPPPPPPPPPQTTGDVNSTEGAGGSVSPPHFPIVTGTDQGGGPHVKVFSTPAIAETMSFFAFAPGFTGGVRVAVGDVNGDGRADVITGAGPGAGPHVKVFDGGTGALLASFFAYSPGFTGGVFVAAGDVNGDGKADLITGAGPGAGPHVRVFDGATTSELGSFFAYDAGFTGGVRVAAGDVNGDGRAEVVTGTGPGTPAHVKVFRATTAAQLKSLLPYSGAFTGGVFVAAGDVNGDGLADVVTGAGPGAGPHVKVFHGGGATELQSFFAYDAGFNGGVHVAAGDVNGDGRADVITAVGPGAGPHVKAFNAVGGGELASFFAYDPGFNGGVFVGSKALQPIRVRTRTLTFNADSTLARLPVGCPAGAQGFCRGTVTLLVGVGGSPRAAGRPVVVGRALFSLRPGERSGARMRLTKAGKARLARRRRLTVTTRITTRDAAANVSKSEVTLKLRAKRR